MEVYSIYVVLSNHKLSKKKIKMYLGNINISKKNKITQAFTAFVFLQILTINKLNTVASSLQIYILQKYLGFRILQVIS